MQNEKIIAAIAAYLEKERWSWRLPLGIHETATEIAAAIAPLVETGEGNEWKNAPEWANYIATDWNGQRHWFESEPYKHNSGCWFNENGTKYQKINTPNGDGWDISLQCRPK